MDCSSDASAAGVLGRLAEPGADDGGINSDGSPVTAAYGCWLGGSAFGLTNTGGDSGRTGAVAAGVTGAGGGATGGVAGGVKAAGGTWAGGTN